MATELQSQSNAAQLLYVRALATAWRNRTRLNDPSIWPARDPDIEEKMLRDHDIAQAIGFRKHLIAGRQWAMVPRRPNAPEAPLAVAIATELCGCIRRFSQARMNLARAFFSGSRFARVHGETRQLKLGDGKPRQWWIPLWLEDKDKRTFQLVPELDSGQKRVRWQEWCVAESSWKDMTVEDIQLTIRHVYQDDESTLGHGRALREALGWLWFAKQNIMQASLSAADRFGEGTLQARIDGLRDAGSGLPNAEVVDAWTEVLTKLRGQNVLVFDKSDDVTVQDSNGEGWQLLEALRRELRTGTTTLVLGANLTTTADQGGSYALAEIQENSTEALIQFDRETLEETLTDQLLHCVWWKNHANLYELGIANEKPRFSITQEKRQDPKERAGVAQVLSGMGVELSREDVLEQTGFRQPEPGEDVIAPQPQQPSLGGFPMLSQTGQSSEVLQ